MDLLKIRNNLIGTGYFQENVYLDLYMKLIQDNQETSRQMYKTQRHHVFPKSLSILVGTDVDNTQNNVVNLLQKDHLLAHYYLSLCTTGQMLNKMLSAMFFLCGNIVTYSRGEISQEQVDKFLQQLDNYQYLYEIYRIMQSQRRLGHKQSNESILKSIQGRKNLTMSRGGIISLTPLNSL